MLRELRAKDGSCREGGGERVNLAGTPRVARTNGPERAVARHRHVAACTSSASLTFSALMSPLGVIKT
jgi:hypothetical protein